MVFTTQKISEEMDLYYYQVDYYSDGVQLTYWQKEEEGGEYVESKHHSMLIDPLNAKELFSTVLKHIIEEDPFD